MRIPQSPSDKDAAGESYFSVSPNTPPNVPGLIYTWAVSSNGSQVCQVTLPVQLILGSVSVKLHDKESEIRAKKRGGLAPPGNHKQEMHKPCQRVLDF